MTRFTRSWIGLLLPVLLSSCFTPPALRAGRGDSLGREQFPPGAELVALEIEPGQSLRGVFVPAEEGAPVVVHLLESGGTIAAGALGIRSYAMLWQLRDRGLASLAVDYRGLGASDGERSSRNLREDALVIWQEALRRTGGRPERIVLRGISIGSLAVAALLDEGCEPGAVVLVAPVRDETVVGNHARVFHGSLMALGAWLIFRRPVGVDLVEQLAHLSAPLLVVLPEADVLLTDEDRELIEQATRAAGGQLLRRPVGHGSVVLEGRAVLAAEDSVYAGLPPERSPGEVRFQAVLAGLMTDQAAEVRGDESVRQGLLHFVRRFKVDSPGLALALSQSALIEADLLRSACLVEALRQAPPEQIEVLPPSALLALVQIDDPAGPLDPAELEWAAELGRDGLEQNRGPVPERLVAWAAELGLQRWSIYRRATGYGVGSLDDESLPVDAPARLRLPAPDSLRQAVRLLLKAQGIPERVTDAVNGTPELQVFHPDRWRPLSLGN